MSEEKFDPDQDDKCPTCKHDVHEPGNCNTLYVYNRGPNDPPGNQSCLCGVAIQFHPIVSNVEVWEGQWPLPDEADE